MIDRANIATRVLIFVGVLLALAGAALGANLRGSADFVIKNMTSRSLGNLAPGFAASRAGFDVYAGLLSAIGVVLIGFGSTDWWGGLIGVIIGVVGVVLFVALSVLAIVGEVRTYRALKR